MCEVWSPVKRYEDRYEVSSRGNVRGIARRVPSCYGSERDQLAVVLKPRLDRCGYVRVKLCDGAGKKQRPIHQLVAEAFIPNPEGLPCVNHLDFNRTNNCVENLEWCSYQENNHHSHREGRHRAPAGPDNGAAVRIEQVEPLSGEVVKNFNTMTEAARSVGVSLGTMSSAVSRGRRLAHYEWRRVGKTRRLLAALGIPITPPG